jgi:hypothetical protein
MCSKGTVPEDCQLHRDRDTDQCSAAREYKRRESGGHDADQFVVEQEAKQLGLDQPTEHDWGQRLHGEERRQPRRSRRRPSALSPSTNLKRPALSAAARRASRANSMASAAPAGYSAHADAERDAEKKRAPRSSAQSQRRNRVITSLRAISLDAVRCNAG